MDLILANGTAALQAASAATGTIPILGTSITEYGVALGIDDFSGTVGSNVSGTSDLAPLDEQAAMVKELVPQRQDRGPALLLRRGQQPVSGGDREGLPGGPGLHL